ncbi:MAG TPA: glycosyltransferase family 4 protein [Bryobacteraceae bacterium]|nr:glycosyltransferase family 4 protein [Bryobacteraceae bacterium]
MMKILFISHGHPAFVPGGGEIAAYELFQGFQSAGEDTHFLARTGPPHHRPHGGTPFLACGNNSREYFFYSRDIDHFLQSSRVTDWGLLREFLESVRPDVVHFQHTAHLGMEWLEICRQCLPNAAIIYTLHEYLPICNHAGQMIRTYDRQVCEGWSPANCHLCFPEHTPQDFRLRELFIKTHFRNVDTFVSPSRFLMNRYVEWGIPESALHFIENGRKIQPEAPPRLLPPDEGRANFGYLGQLNPFKGVLVLIEAMRLLARSSEGRRIRLFIHGSNLETQPPEFQEQYAAALEACEGNVTVRPAYTIDEMPHLMQQIDWVVAPSIWYENAPLVVQEAYMHKRPVISSDIGGMAEKVVDGVTGLHFRSGSSEDLARVLLHAAGSPQLWESLRAAAPPVFSIEQSMTAHRELYEQILRRRLEGVLAVSG